MAGLCGWTVHDDKLDEWKRRRQLWFMQGKEGKQYGGVMVAGDETSEPRP